jgi:hypothetical protein
MCKHPWPSALDIPDTAENRLRKLTIIEKAAVRAFEENMQNEVIPRVLETIRRRREAAELNRHKFLY